MIAVLLQGGIGNQMFEYATGFSLAKKRNTDLIFIKRFVAKNNIGIYRLDNFNISAKECGSNDLPDLLLSITKNRYIRKTISKLNINEIRYGNWAYITQTSKHRENPFNSTANNLIIDGYWQNPSYFNEYKKELQNEFSLINKVSSECKKWERQIMNCESVSIHIRRGDYLKKENKQYLIKDGYYDLAINYIKNVYPNAQFFIFSDDVEWIKNHYGTHNIVSLNSKNKDIEEMHLMSVCKHNINANSTYSWWASYLNKSETNITITPERLWNPQMIPQKWITVTNSSITSVGEMHI